MPLARRLLLILVVLAAIACRGGSGVAGGYQLQSEDKLFGQAGKFHMDLNDDKRFAITLGAISMGEGTWKVDGDIVTLNLVSGKGALGDLTTYKAVGGKLIPMRRGAEVKTGRFVRR